MKRLVLCQFLMAFNVLKKGPRPSGTCRAQSRCGRTSAAPYTESQIDGLVFRCNVCLPVCSPRPIATRFRPSGLFPSPPCPLSPIHLPPCAESALPENVRAMPL